MNMFGFIHFNREIIADEVARRARREIRLGRLNWHVDSFHIYGKDLESARQRLFERLAHSSFEDRVFMFQDPDIQEIYQQADVEIYEKIRMEDTKRK